MRHIALQAHGFAPFLRQAMFKGSGEANVTFESQSSFQFITLSLVGMSENKKI